jgi:hypothetical protein
MQTAPGSEVGTWPCAAGLVGDSFDFLTDTMGGVVSKWVDPLTRRRCQVRTNAGHMCKNNADVIIYLNKGQLRFYFACHSHKSFVSLADLILRIEVSV